MPLLAAGSGQKTLCELIVVKPRGILRLVNRQVQPMSPFQPHRKKVEHNHQPGDFHEFTFSCYRRMKLPGNDAWRGYPARSIDDAAAKEEFLLIAC